MDSSVYMDDALVLVQNLMRKTLGETYTYYEGDPITIPIDSLPCVIVELFNVEVRTGQATGTDDLAEQILIRVCLNKSDDLGASDDYDLTERKLRWIVQGRDRQTGTYHNNSILHAIRKNITLGGYNIDSSVDVNYDVNARPNQMMTSEATISISTRERIFVPERM